jgi:hypothetical protein
MQGATPFSSLCNDPVILRTAVTGFDAASDRDVFAVGTGAKG